MAALSRKIDFAVIFRVKNANPNGDPLNGNRPRVDYSNHGEVSDVAIKRKIRDRLLEQWTKEGKKKDDGNMIFVQSDDRKADDATSLRDRAEEVLDKDLGSDRTAELACEKWLDVRAFGQLFALKGAKKKGGKHKDEGGEQNAGNGDTGV
jgi:CRISPR-associated protein Csd2